MGLRPGRVKREDSLPQSPIPTTRPARIVTAGIATDSLLPSAVRAGNREIHARDG